MKIRFLHDKPRLVFFLCYTLLFVIGVRFAGFVMPFVISVVIAVVMKPLYDYLRSRFRFRSTFAATMITLLIFGVFFAVAGFLMYLVVRQALSLIAENRSFIERCLASGDALGSLREVLMSGRLFDTASEVIQALFRAVPAVITFIVITFSLSVFFLHHLGDIRDRLLRRAGEEYSPLLCRVFRTAYTLVRRFLRSYLGLYLITFVEAVFIFYLTRVPYPLAFAFITAIADILPVLGPGTVYIPIAVYFILQKNYLGGITLIVFFLITVVLRQILEPRLVSDSVKVHPLVVLSAIYFSIVSMSIWVLFYVVSVVLVYKVLDASGVFEKSMPDAKAEVDIS